VGDGECDARAGRDGLSLTSNESSER
jgi:hypothetical protein